MLQYNVRKRGFGGAAGVRVPSTRRRLLLSLVKIEFPIQASILIIKKKMNENATPESDERWQDGFKIQDQIDFDAQRTIGRRSAVAESSSKMYQKSSLSLFARTHDVSSSTPDWRGHHHHCIATKDSSS
jgi:hypothetical protein